VFVDDLTAGDLGYASTLRGGPATPGSGLAQFLGKFMLSSPGFGINNNTYMHPKRYQGSLNFITSQPGVDGRYASNHNFDRCVRCEEWKPGGR
jgi:hypothetical protein